MLSIGCVFFFGGIIILVLTSLKNETLTRKISQLLIITGVASLLFGLFILTEEAVQRELHEFVNRPDCYQVDTLFENGHIKDIIVFRNEKY